MKLKLFLLTYFPLLLAWSLDFLSKSLIFNNQHFTYKLGALNIAYYENHGIIMGSFDELPLIMRTVFLTTIGVSFVASYPLLMNLLDLRTRRMMIGISLLFGGILGNVTDRISHGFVVDMIYFQTQEMMTPIFNIADMIQWAAYILILTGMFKEINQQIPDNERRGLKWIDFKFQSQFCLTLLGIVFCVTSIPLIFGFTFLKYSLINAEYSQEKISHFINSYIISSLFIQGAICIATISLGKLISSRIVGPIIGIKRYLNHTLEGKSYTFKLRKKDHFKELESPLTKINQRLNQANSKDDIEKDAA